MDDKVLNPRISGESPREIGAPGVGTQPEPRQLPPPSRPPWGWVLLILAIGLSYWGWRTYLQPASQPAPADQSAAAPNGPPGGPQRKGDRGAAQPVGVATVAPRDVRVIVDALGTVTPIATVTVISQISGYLQQVAFTEGQKVKKGDFLAQIDPRPYQALKMQYEGQLAHDQGLLAQAKADDIRYQTLLKQNSIARQTAEDQVYVVQQYEGTVRSDQALIDAQALNIAYCHIVSPVDGRVGLRLVDAGNFITAGAATGIAVVTQLQPMSVIFSVPEDALRKIAPKMRDGQKLTVTAYDRANVSKLASGEVTVLDNQVDTTTGMVKLRALFDNQDEALFPSQFVNIRLLVDTLQGATAAPTAAIQHGAPGDYAYVVTPDQKSTVRVVKLGQTDGEFVQIVSGLAPGDTVVTDGADRLREGAAVRVVGDKAQADASAPDTAAATPASAPASDPPTAAASPADPAQAQHRHSRKQQQGDGAPAPADAAK
jgi:multidrug efflux system membrane fusion protein